MQPKPAKLTEDGIPAPRPFMQTAQGDLLSLMTFLALSLLIILFVFLRFTHDHSDSNAHFQALSLASRSSSLLINNAKSSA